MKKKTAILLVGAFVFTAAFSGCGKNKEATEAANESVESEDPEGKAKNSNDAEEEEKERLAEIKKQKQEKADQELKMIMSQLSAMKTLLSELLIENRYL